MTSKQKVFFIYFHFRRHHVDVFLSGPRIRREPLLLVLLLLMLLLLLVMMLLLLLLLLLMMLQLLLQLLLLLLLLFLLPLQLLLLLLLLLFLQMLLLPSKRKKFIQFFSTRRQSNDCTQHFLQHQHENRGNNFLPLLIIKHAVISTAAVQPLQGGLLRVKKYCSARLGT